MADLFVQPMPLMRDTTATTATRLLGIGLVAFLTLVDLFATQAILPVLTRHYQVTPAAMGLAVNACTLGMAGVAGLAVRLTPASVQDRLGAASG